MFNRTNYTTIGSGPTYVTTKEYRSPTDESIRILREMEEKAREQVINTIVVKDNLFECKILQHKDITSLTNNYAVIYSLNGKKSELKIGIEEYENLKLEEVAIKIRDALAQDIANKMLRAAFENGFKL